MPSDPIAQTTPGWLVAISFGALLLGLAILWATLPWQGALMASAVAFMAAEFAQVGARWHDEKERANGR